VTENFLTSGEIFHGWPHQLVQLFAGAKLLLFALAVLPTLLSFFPTGPDPAGEVLPRRLARVRVSLVGVAALLLVLLWLPGGVRPQLADVMRLSFVGRKLL
jgi:hypothetical protein